MASQAARPGAGNSAGGGRLAQFKLVLLGESAVGKSSLALRFARRQFHEHYQWQSKPEHTAVVLDDAVEFDIWETSRAVWPQLFGVQAAIVVYDITDANTFTKAKSLVDEIHRHDRNDMVIALAGNKSDLGSRRTVEYEEANAYAEEKGLLFLETSAKNANNVNEIFLAIARKLPREDSGPKAQGISVTGEEGSSSGNKLGQCCNR